MSEKNIKKIGMRDALGEYTYANIGVDADNVDIDETTNLMDKLAEIDTKANKFIYGDNAISLGRKANTAVGTNSVALGKDVTASGNNSHAEGHETIASGQEQHVQGKYNIEDTENKYAHIVGGGKSDANRKNIHTLDWYGNAEFAGDVVAHDSEGNGISLLDVENIIGGTYADGQTNVEYTTQTVTGSTFSPTSSSVSGVTLITAIKDLSEKVADMFGSLTTYFAKKSIYGDNTISSGRKEGTKVGKYSTALGLNTTASGIASHSEGDQSIAEGDYSHAEGIRTIASGQCSHTEGLSTIASRNFQHVQGKYNVEDTGNKYAHIVGGGTSMERKNIHTLDWNGNAEFAGNVIIHDLNGNAISLVDAISLINTALANANLL